MQFRSRSTESVRSHFSSWQATGHATKKVELGQIIGIRSWIVARDPTCFQHINGALNVGCTKAEVVEVVLAVAIFAEFPAAINAMVVAKQIFADRAAGKK